MTEAVKGFVTLLSLALLFAAVVASLSCFNIVGCIVWPRRTQAVQQMLSTAASRCFLLGFVNVACYVGLVALTSWHVLGKMLFVIFAATVLILTGLGLPAMFTLIGEQVQRLAAREGSLLAATISGTAVLGAASVLPWAGQILLVGALLTTYGASLTVLLQSLRTSAAET